MPERNERVRQLARKKLKEEGLGVFGYGDGPWPFLLSYLKKAKEF